MSKLGKILIVVAIILLAVGVTAALTKGFTDTNPYGWLPSFEKMEEGDYIASFEFNTNSEIDFAKLIKDVDGVDNEGQKCYLVLNTDTDGAVAIIVVETPEGDSSAYSLVVNGNEVYSTGNGWVESAKDGISFNKCQITSIANGRAISYYIGGNIIEEAE